MAVSQPDTLASSSVARAVATVAQFGYTDGNRRDAAKDLLYGVGAVGARRCLRWVEHERLLCVLDERR